MLFYTNCTCMWSLAETWSKVWGDENGALSPKFFCHPLQNVKFRGGTHCLREFQYLTDGFRVYTVDFVDFNI